MANTYYDSQLTAEEIEAALEAIDGVIVPANNGKVLIIENGAISAKSVTELTTETVLESLSVTANGDYYPESGVDGFDEVHVSVPTGSTPVLQEKTVTQNGTVTPDAGYDGLSSVVVNVSGGGGGGTLLMSRGQVSTDSAYALAYFASGVDVTVYDAIVVKMYENNTQVAQGATYLGVGGETFYCYGDLTYTMSMNTTLIKCINYRGKYRNLYVDVYGVNV